jgi:seryl-tRNA synthetase
MAWKFLSISKANAEVARLEAEVAAVTKERDEAKAALESNATEVTQHAEEVQASAETLKAEKLKADGQVTSLTSELTAVKAELVAAKAELANPAAQIVQIASHKAAEITGAQGQPPISTTPAGTPEGGAAAASSMDLMQQMNAIKDPTARTVFFRKHQAAILAASRAERAQGKS